MSDLEPTELDALLDHAQCLVDDPHADSGLLTGDSVVLHFAQPSTRTRLSMATAVTRLGGLPVSVGPDELQLGQGETIEDTARVVGTYARLFAIRTEAHADVARYAEASAIPVVNAMTSLHHPCQALADLLTLRQLFGDPGTLIVAWVGDGNNVCHSLCEAIALTGGTLRVATPDELAPDASIWADVQQLARDNGATVERVASAAEAARGAHAIYTDTWVSLADDETVREERTRLLQDHRVDEALLDTLHPDGVLLHCLPAHRGDEVTAAAIDGPRSRVVQQAGNRLPTAAALFADLVTGALT